LGFPTANLEVDACKLIPATGVYAGRWKSRRCAVNIGIRPTFGVGDGAVEVHILNFKGNLRGKSLKVDLLRRIRPERRFSNISRLKKQIVKDLAVCEL
jgi:FAD synthase